MSIGENIRRIRKENGLTQKKLGNLCGINEVQIRQYEAGRANPKIETIWKIASALNVPINAIKEDLIWDKNSDEMKRLDIQASAIDGIVAVIADIYGKVEDKELVGDYFSGHYYVVGKGKNKFIL